jgi:hypothetical protein
MKNQLNTAGTTFINKVACTAKNSFLKSFRMTFLFSVMMLFTLSTFSKGSGCGAWTYKNKNDRKYKNHMVKLYKTCPGGVCKR